MQPGSQPSQPAGRVPATLSGLLGGMLGGVLLACLESGLVLVYARDLFLSSTELLRYLGLALSALPALCGAVGLLGAGLLARLERGAGRDQDAYLRQVRLLVMTASAPLCAWTLWLLSAGRRVRAVPGRTLVV